MRGSTTSSCSAPSTASRWRRSTISTAIRNGLYPDPKIYANDIVVVGDSKARRMFQQFIQMSPLLTTPVVRRRGKAPLMDTISPHAAGLRAGSDAVVRRRPRAASALRRFGG